MAMKRRGEMDRTQEKRRNVDDGIFISSEIANAHQGDMGQAEEPERRHFWWMGIGVVLLLAAVAATYWITRHTLTPPTEKVREEAVSLLAPARPGGDRVSPPSSPETGSSFARPQPSARPHATPEPGRMTQGLR